MATPGTYAIDLADLKYAQLTADTGTSGPSYSALKDLAAAAQLTLTPEQGDTRELRGDGGVVQVSVAKGAFKATLRCGGIQPQALADFFGHTLVASGTTPNQKNTLTLKDNAAKPYFKIEGQALNNDVGDTHLRIYKFQADGAIPEISLQDGEWGTIEITGTCYWTTSTTVVNAIAQTLLADLVQNETATAIA